MWETLLRKNLRALIDLYVLGPGHSRSSIAKLALNDSSWVTRCVYSYKPSGFTIRSYDRICVELSNTWPDDIAWPDDIPRPPHGRS